VGKKGLLGWQRRGGMVAPNSTSESVVTVELDSPAAAVDVVMRKWLNMWKMIVLWATPLDDFRSGSPARNGMTYPAEKKAKNKANREKRNVLVDNDLRHASRGIAQESNPTVVLARSTRPRQKAESRLSDKADRGTLAQTA
jgi:hypothetical protein